MANPDDPRSQPTLMWGGDSRTCPECGGEFDADVTFCPNDGTRLIEGAPQQGEEQTPADEDPLLGTTLMGKWKVEKRLGAGSFGTVYKVQDLKGGWTEALKILGVDRLTGAEAENARKRFLREAQIMKRLGTESQHIVGLSTYEEDLEAGLIYFTMEMVEGRSLSDIVADEGPMDVERTIRLSLQVCEALRVAHEGPEPVVHRDLKLENLMLTVDRSGTEVIKVLDFGIAKIAERESEARLTTVGTLGTPGYAAPEQLRAEAVDGRTDLFAFGVIIYSLLTGVDPWLGNPATVATEQIYELMVATERGEVRPFSETGVDVPPALQNIVMRLLRREPDDRFATASELRDALLRIQAGGTAVDAASLRVLTDEPGVQVQVRAGRRTVAEGPTPCNADGLAAGTYKVSVTDERYEPVDTTVTLDAGEMQDITLVTNPRSTGVGSTVRRNKGVLAAAVVVALLGAGVVVLQPWGTTLGAAELAERASEVASARLVASGMEGRLDRGALPALPFRVQLAEDAMPAAVSELRAAGVAVDARWLLDRIEEDAAAAQAALRYFGSDGSDVRSYAERMAAIDPESAAARSLLLKVAERMAWDAEAAAADGEGERAGELVEECLTLVPEHPSCVAARDLLGG